MKSKYNKYGNKKTIVGGIKFDSKAEASRYTELKMFEKFGKIENLELQPSFVICPSVVFNGRKQPAKKYIADFKYLKDGVEIVEDVKGMKTSIYMLKRSLFLSQYPQYTFIETEVRR